MFDTVELAEARRDYIAEMLPERATVRRRVGTKDAQQIRLSSPTEPERGLRARVCPIRVPHKGIEGGRPLVIADWEISVGEETGERSPEQLDILPADEIAIKNKVFRVVDTDKGRSNALCLVIAAIRIQ
jgi:hypothetical protein